MISAYSVFCRLAGAELAQRTSLESHSVRRSLQAGATLFDAGEVHPNVHVVVHGVIRMEYRTAAGDTWVKGFAEEGVCFASLTALAPGGRTSYAASAATDAVPLWRAVYADRVHSVGWRFAANASLAEIEAEVERAARFGVSGIGSPWMTTESETALLARDVGTLLQRHERER